MLVEKNVKVQVILLEPNFPIKSPSITALRKIQDVSSQDRTSESKKEVRAALSSRRPVLCSIVPIRAEGAGFSGDEGGMPWK